MATQTRVEAAGSFAEINGLRIYYEVHGEGAPVVMLHGGVGASEVFGALLPKLAERRRAIPVHLQAHGHTSDADRPLRFEDMADDVAALIGHLGLGSADVLGYSLGGQVALQMAIRHPEAVRSLVAVSAAARRLGWYPEVLQGMSAMPSVAPNIAASPLAELYPGHDWRKHIGKLTELLERDYDWSAHLSHVDLPTMLVFADADSVTLAHITEMYSLLGGGQRDAGLDGSLRPAARLAVIPGTTHYNIVSSPLLAAVVADFLEARDRR